ncbi:MAG: carbohydrate ABC transporter substrate-binding protein, partial [Oscillospiraceae bacterium]
MKHRKIIAFATSLAAFSSVITMSGCSFNNNSSGKTVVKMLQYKPEAVKAFEAIEQRFNETHDDIELKIESPNEAMTVLKTRLIKEDYPDIIGIGGDINYSN